LILLRGRRGATLIISYVLVLLWMGVIFKLSSQGADQSKKLSKGVTSAVVKTAKVVTPKAKLNAGRLNNKLRKYAHFFSFLILGVLVLNALWKSGVSGFRAMLLALLICAVYAAMDELHQLFVPGRGAELLDVLIDSAGAVVGIIIAKTFVVIGGKGLGGSYKENKCQY
jgi:VanZ family protein